jgi:hypothetical protein
MMLVLLAAACGGEQQTEEQPPAQETSAPAMTEEQVAELETIRQVTAKYADVNAAIADGFIRDPSGECVNAAGVGLPAEQGAMGVHYVHPGRLGLVQGERVDGTDAVIDWSQPDVLMYEPQADGTEQLMGVEYLVFRKAWEDAGNTAEPSFFGVPFVGMADDPNTPADEAHGFTPHYELHVWTVRENPTGVFAEFNPQATCANAAAHQGHGTGS